MPATFDVVVDGVALSGHQRSRLTSLRVSSRLSQPGQCELAFAAPPALTAEIERWPLGATVGVRVDGTPLFDGEVTCIEVVHEPDGAVQLRVRCYDPLHRLRKRQQLRTFTDVDAADLAGALVADLGLAVTADEPGPRHPVIVQHRQQDFDLLAETAAAAGLHPIVRGSELRLVSLAGTGEPVDLELGTSLLEAAIEANLDRVRSWVSALAWHPDQAESLEELADKPRGGRDTGLAPYPSVLGLDGGRMLVNQPAASSEQLAGRALAELDADTAGAVTVRGVATGNPLLLAGVRVVVRGVAAPVSGTFVLTSAVHTVDERGYLTSVDTTPPEPAPRTAGPGVAVMMGRVVDVDDPARLGRVRVALPDLGMSDSSWFSVVCAAAGRGKGITALPDVDDQVLVVLPHGDPATGFVLGALFGTLAPPDTGVHGGKVRRWSLRTSGGQSVVLDDQERRVRIRNAVGSAVDLGPDRLRIHAATDLVIEAPGRAIVVRAASVDFEQATST